MLLSTPLNRNVHVYAISNLLSCYRGSYSQWIPGICCDVVEEMRRRNGGNNEVKISKRVGYRIVITISKQRRLLNRFSF